MNDIYEEKIISEILKRKPNLTHYDIERMISKKMSELNMSRKTALYLICMEMGVKLTSEVTDYLEISRLKGGLNRIRIIGRIIWLKDEEYYESPPIGRRPYVRGGIADRSGTANIIFWGVTKNDLESRGIVPGAIIDVNGAYTKKNMAGLTEVHVGENTDVSLAEEDVGQPTLKDLLVRVDKADLSKPHVNVYGCVLTPIVKREYAAEGRSGVVGNLLVGAEDHAIRVVLWDNALEEYSWINPGDVIAIFHGRVKRGLRGDFEIHIGRSSHIEYLPGEKVNIRYNPTTIAELNVGYNLKSLTIRVLAKGKERINIETGTRSIGFYVIDGTGDATMTLIGNKIIGASRRIHLGDIIKIVNFRVSKRGEEVYIFCDDATQLELDVSEPIDIPEAIIPTKGANELTTSDKVVTVKGRVVKKPVMVIPGTAGLKDIYEFVIEDDAGNPINITYRGSIDQYSDDDIDIGDNIRVECGILDVSSLLYPGMIPNIRLRAFSKIVKVS